MPCKLDSTKNPRSFEKHPTPRPTCSGSIVCSHTFFLNRSRDSEKRFFGHLQKFRAIQVEGCLLYMTRWSSAQPCECPSNELLLLRVAHWHPSPSHHMSLVVARLSGATTIKVVGNDSLEGFHARGGVVSFKTLTISDFPFQSGGPSLYLMKYASRV